MAKKGTFLHEAWRPNKLLETIVLCLRNQNTFWNTSEGLSVTWSARARCSTLASCNSKIIHIYVFILCQMEDPIYSCFVSKKLAKTVKSSLSNGHLKFWAGARKLKANSKCFNLRGILCKIVGWPQKVGWPKKTFLEKVYQVDTSQNEKLETNTIRLFSDQLDLSTRSYAECAQKAHYFYRFFRFFSAEKLANFRFYFTILCGRFQWNFVPIWMI